MPPHPCRAVRRRVARGAGTPLKFHRPALRMLAAMPAPPHWAFHTSWVSRAGRSSGRAPSPLGPWLALAHARCCEPPSPRASHSPAEAPEVRQKSASSPSPPSCRRSSPTRPRASRHANAPQGACPPTENSLGEQIALRHWPPPNTPYLPLSVVQHQATLPTVLAVVVMPGQTTADFEFEGSSPRAPVGPPLPLTPDWTAAAPGQPHCHVRNVPPSGCGRLAPKQVTLAPR
mmetsp:Transcript_19482/g.61110  ORF Transcript_19482/g.61110 Transcript_19482/m.61110 type:complete len:231 (+) Transcript_19482:461-1153(+)